MLFKLFSYFLLLGSFCSAQSHEQLMRYCNYYNQDIQSFKDFMKIEPSASQSNAGIQQIVYELEGHNIGIEEHPSNNDKIGEIYVFQTTENPGGAQKEWRQYFSKMSKDKSVTFVKGVFDDGIVKENNLTHDELLSLINARTLNANRSYGIRYRKQNAFFSLFVVKGKLIFTMDDKNY